MKFSKQLFLIFCATATIPLLVLWFSLSQVMFEKEVANVKNQHLLIARNLGAALQRYHTDIKAGFEVVSSNLIAGNKIANIETYISRLNFRHFCIANIQTGKIIAQAAPKSIPCPETVPAKRMAVFKSLAKENTAIFSPVLAGPNNISIIYILKRVGDNLAIGAVTTDYFVKLGSAVAFGKKGHAAIIDQVGTVLAHPKASWLAERKNISKISIVRRMLAGETGVETFYSPALKANMIAGFTHIKGTSWSVMIPQPVSELHAAALSAHKSIFLIVALCVLLAAGVATIIGRMVMKPLQNIIKAAEAVEHGDKNIEMDVDKSWHVPQEFRDMQERFNAMAKAVSKYQETQKQQREHADKENKSKTEYFANLAHELKTPLNSILGFSSVLRQSSPGSLKPHERAEFLDHIEKSASHLLSFVNDLLDLNRLDMGAHNLNEQTFFLIDPIRFCETTLRKQIEEKNIKTVVECENKSIKICADERAVNQILINLVGNAVRYSLENGEIRIKTELLRDGRLQIDVHDNGIGIPEDDLKDILLPFKRANDPHLAEIHGTGLGLSIVSKLARLQNMEFKIESEHGFSTTATLIIPSDRVILGGDKKAACCKQHTKLAQAIG